MPLRNPDILGYQAQTLESGRIRMGAREKHSNGKLIPVRLATFKFTSGSRPIIEEVAARFGGSRVVPFEGRRGQWETVTDRDGLDVWVSPRGEPVDSTMELWDGPRCRRKCDAVQLLWPPNLAGRPCACPLPEDPADPQQVQAALDKRKQLAAMNPPQACRPRTRFRVLLPQLPGVGEWVLGTGSEAVVRESGDGNRMLVAAREQDMYLPARLEYSWREKIDDGKPYPVAVLRINTTLEQIARGELPAGTAGFLGQLGAGAPGPAALTVGPSAPAARETVTITTPPPAPAAADLTPETAGEDRHGGHSVNCTPEDGPEGCHPNCPAAAGLPAIDPQADPEAAAQAIASAARAATTAARVRALWKQAALAGILNQQVNTTAEGEDEVWEPLVVYLEARGAELARREKAQG